MKMIACVRDALAREYLSGFEFVNDGRDLLFCDADIIVMDAVMAGTDALEVAKKNPNCVVLLPEYLEDWRARFYELGAIAANIDELDAAVFASRKASEEALKEKIRCVLDEFGIKRSIKGYSCLLDAVLIASGDESSVNSIKEKIYIPISKKQVTSPANIERVMRFAIESAMGRARVDVVQRMFGYSLREMTGKPTNSEFIARVSELIK